MRFLYASNGTHPSKLHTHVACCPIAINLVALCCAVLCCAVLCCAVLCCAVQGSMLLGQPLGSNTPWPSRGGVLCSAGGMAAMDSWGWD
jgi:hypothetical protein